MCLCVFSITYVPAEYLEEYKASLEPAKEDVFSETAPVPPPAPKYVLTQQFLSHHSTWEVEVNSKVPR